jgi:sodium transport system permease protein
MSLVIGLTVRDNQKKIQDNLKITIVDKGNSNFLSFLKSQKNIKLIVSKDIKQNIKNGKILAALTIPKNFDKNVANEIPQNVILTYDNSSSNAMDAVNILNSYIDKYSKGIVAKRLEKRNINSNILTPINVIQDTVDKKDSGLGKIMISMLLPLLLIFGSVANTIAPAVDLGAGEKERGTLEPLLTTKANRMCLLWGKLFAITVMGMIVSIASLTGLFIAFNQKSGMFVGVKDINLGLGTLILVMVLPIMLTMAFGALGLAISIYAKSFKEAQTYLSPITILSMILVYATMIKDGKNIETFYFNIPIANAACLTKEFLAGVHNTTHIAITFGWMAVYIIASILFSRYMFSKEDVVFRV